MRQEQKYIRMAHIVSRLKTGEDMGIPELQKSLQELEQKEGVRLECGLVTIQRDISELKKMKCPIVYHRSKTRRTYELTDKSWELHSAPLVGGDEMLAVVLGAQFASGFLPRTVGGRVRSVCQDIFAANTENFLRTVDMTSLKILTPPMSKECEAVFSTLFDAWKQRRMATIRYCDEKGDTTVRTIEPHALLFHNMAWYVRAFCHLKMAQRTFAVSRIESVETLECAFESRPELYRDATSDNFDSRPPYRNIVVELTRAGRQYAATHVLHAAQKITVHRDGRCTMTVPEKPKHLVVEWILAQRGNATPVAPLELKDEVRNACQKIMISLS